MREFAERILSVTIKYGKKWWKKGLIAVAVSLALAFVLEWLQVRTQPVFGNNQDPLHWKRLFKLAAILFALLAAFLYFHAGTRISSLLRNAKDRICTDKKNTLIHIAVFIGSAVLSYVFLLVYIPYVLGKEPNRILCCFILACSIAVGCLFCFRKTLARKAEIFFLVFSLLIGGNMAFFAADTGTVCWDDIIHYKESVSFSYLGEIRLTGVEEAVLTPHPEQRFEMLKLDEWHAGQHEVYQKGATEVVLRHTNLKNFWSMFSGVGLYFGRVLGLPFHLIWELGRFFGLLAYSIIGYFAIRRLKSGKMILASVLLIPENLFLAASYSYDPGVTVFLALGMSCFFAEWQEPDKRLTWKNAVVMILALFLGCYAKAIYFPLLLFPLFLPKGKFENSKQRLWFACLTLIAMILLIISFVLPFIGSYATAGDKRGGEDVSSSGQIAFILSNPLAYAKILTDFLKSYLRPDKIADFTSFFAYLGKAPNYNIYLIILAIAAFSDKSICDDRFAGKGRMRALLLLVIFGTICLVATSMYVAFTPVGLGTVNGCQPRYMLPLFFPAIMLCGLKGTDNGANRTVYNGILFALIGYVGFTSVLYNFINLYY